MGLDQSIFTTSKTIAKAIYEGSTPGGKWSSACFSPKTLENENSWTHFDTYAQSRLKQNAEDNYTNPLFTVINFSSIDMNQGMIGSEKRAETLKVMEDLGAPKGIAGLRGSVDDLEVVRNYQIGLFRKCNALHGWMCRRARAEIGSDELAGFNVDTLRALRYDCQRVLDAFAKSQRKGEKVAERVFPTYPGLSFGDYEYDDLYVEQIERIAEFADVLLATPVPVEEAQDAFLFAYSPWY